MPKPCQDCPEQPIESGPARPEKPAIGWVIYTGGPPENHLAMMQHTLPSDFKRAHFLSNGSIQYEKGPDDWEPPSPIEGYERDVENDWLFHPLWESCQHRMYGTEIKEACECIQVLTMCTYPDTELNKHGKVVFTICKSCPQRVPIPVPVVVRPRSFTGTEPDQPAPSPRLNRP